MGLSSHQILSIVIIVYFLPATIPAVLLSFRHGIGKQWGWLYLIILAVFRVVGAVLQIAAEETQVSGLSITARLLASIGVMTLLLAMLEIIENVKTTLLHFDPIPARCWTFLHLSQYAAFILSIVGASLSRDDLNRAAAVIVASLFALQTIISIIFYRHLRSRNGDKRLMTIIFIAVPFLTLRVIYMLLSTFSSKYDGPFATKRPNTVASALMQYLMEFIVYALFIYAGFVMPPVPKKADEETSSQTQLRGYPVS